MTFAKLPELYEMVKYLPNETVTSYFWIFVNEMFHVLMYKYIHQPIYHTHLKYPEHSAINLFGSLLTITYKTLLTCQICKAFRKTSNILFISQSKNTFSIATVTRDVLAQLTIVV